MAAVASKKSGQATTVTSEEARLGLGELINRVLYRNERLRVTRRGKPVMALVPIEDLELLEKVLDALEDELDLPVIKERLRNFEQTGESIPWEQIKAERGSRSQGAHCRNEFLHGVDYGIVTQRPVVEAIVQLSRYGTAIHHVDLRLYCLPDSLRGKSRCTNGNWHAT